MRRGPALVFCASGAVLVLEILAVRLLAPYVGATLETYTTIIGVVLAGIAGGSAVGGRLADRVDPHGLVAVLLALGGVFAIATVPLVRVFGVATEGGGPAAALVIALLAFLPPAAVLSAVTPAVAKAELRDLGQTGSVVGRLSAFATAGALAGTFATGFVLVPLLPTRATVYGIGGALVLAGVVLGARRRTTIVSGAVVLALAGVAAGSRCETESVYFCAQVVADADRPTGRTLVLDDLRHSYVDLADPLHLEFAYARWIGAMIDARRPRDAVFIGGGGFTLPRYLAAVSDPARPARSVVLEVDRKLVDLDRRELGLRTSDALRVRIGDARQTLRDVPRDSADLVVGDAFGGLSVPWHLATRELVEDVRRVLRSDGLYTINLIDHGPLGFARAEAATLLAVFDHVAVIDDAEPGGNVVLAGSDAPLDLAGLDLGAGGVPIDAERFAGDARVLTDDRAPADQLLTTRR
jgi:MFS family permease